MRGEREGRREGRSDGLGRGGPGRMAGIFAHTHAGCGERTADI